MDTLITLIISFTTLGLGAVALGLSVLVHNIKKHKEKASLSRTCLLVLTFCLIIFTPAINTAYALVVNGTDIGHNDWPEVVALRVTRTLATANPQTLVYRCTGTFLSRETIDTARLFGMTNMDVILTAAHCLSPDDAGRVVTQVKYTRGEGDSTHITAQTWAINPSWTNTLNNGVNRHDVGIVFFNGRHTFSSGLPICDQQPNVGNQVTLVGFGCNDYTATSPTVTCAGSGVNSKREGTSTIQVVGDMITFTGPVRDGDGTLMSSGSGDSGGPYIVSQNGANCIAAVNSGGSLNDTDGSGTPNNGDTKTSEGTNLHNNSSRTFLTGALPGLDCDIYEDNCQGRVPALYTFLIGEEVPADWLAAYTPYVWQHGIKILKDQIVADHGARAIPTAYNFLVGEEVPADWLAAYTPYLRQHGLDILKDQILADHALHRIPSVYQFYVGGPISADWQAAYEPYLRQHGLEQLKSQIVADHGRHRIPEVYRFYTGDAIPAHWQATYEPYLWQHGLEQLKSQIVADHGRHRIPEVYRFYTGDAIPAHWQATYEPYLRQHGLEQLKSQIVADHGRHRIPEVYSAITGGPITDHLYASYTDGLRIRGLEGVRDAIAYSEETRIALETHYQAVWGAMAELEDNYYESLRVSLKHGRLDAPGGARGYERGPLSDRHGARVKCTDHLAVKVVMIR